MTTLSKLSQYGNNFQTKVIGVLLTQRQFLIDIFDSLEAEYFENTSHQWIVEKIIDYFHKFHTTPTIEVLSIEVKKIENEVLRIAITESLREAYKITDAKDIDYIQREFKSFCSNQQMKKALVTSVNLLDVGDFDGIRTIINAAIRAGESKNLGIDYKLDVEARYRNDDRNPIPFPWPVFNDLTQGGYGKGDLVLIFGNPKGGKSWAVVAMGAFAASLGYNVLHYTLELGEGYVGKRYDSVLTKIPVDQLDKHRSKVEEVTSNLKGRIKIKEYPPKSASMDTLESHIQQLETQEDFIPDLIIIDYLDYIKSKGKNSDRKGEIDDVYIQGKALAKRLGIPVISPSQANRTGAGEDILEGKHAAGSYDKIMIADILISLARNRKDRVNGTGKWHWMGNRYGPDGLTFNSKVNTEIGEIEIFNTPIDDELDEKSLKKSKTEFNALDEEDKDFLRQKFFS